MTSNLWAIRFLCKPHPDRAPVVTCWNCAKPISVDYVRSADGRGKGVVVDPGTTRTR